MSDIKPKYEKKIPPLAYALIGAAGLGMLFIGVPAFRGQGEVEKVASINGQDITRYQLDRAVSNIGGKENPDVVTLRQEALDRIIGQTIKQQHALSSGYQFSDNALYNLIKSQYPDSDVYQQMLDTRHISAKAYQAGLRQSQTIQNYYHFINLAVQSKAPTSKEALLKQLGQQRAVTVITVPLKPFADKIKATEENVKNYYDKHKNDYLSAEYVDIRYIVFDSEKLVVPESITPEQLQAEKQKRLEEVARSGYYLIFDHSEDAKLAAAAITDGSKTFADISADIEKGKISGQTGELTPTAQGKGISEEVDNALFALAKEGDTSAVFNTEYGDMMVNLGKIHNPVNIDETSLRQVLAAEKGAEQYAELANKLYDVAQEGADISQLATTAGVEIQTLQKVTPETVEPEWLQQPALYAQLFGEKSVDVNGVSLPVELSATKSLFFVVSERIKPSILPLNSVRERVTQDYKNEMAKLAQEKSAKAILIALEAGQSVETLLKQAYAGQKQYQGISYLQDPATLILSPQMQQTLLAQTEKITLNEGEDNHVVISRIDAIKQADLSKLPPKLGERLAQEQYFRDIMMLQSDLDQWLRNQSKVTVDTEALSAGVEK